MHLIAFVLAIHATDTRHAKCFVHRMVSSLTASTFAAGKKELAGPTSDGRTHFNAVQNWQAEAVVVEDVTNTR